MKSYTILTNGKKRKPRTCKGCKCGEVDFVGRSKKQIGLLLQKTLGGIKHGLFHVNDDGYCDACKRLKDKEGLSNKQLFKRKWN